MKAVKKLFISLFALATALTAVLLLTVATPVGAQPAKPQVVFKTTVGDFTLELYPDQAPLTVKNFLAYVERDFYTGTIFHRVIKDFVVQGGGFDDKMSQKKTLGTVKNEADNGLKNDVGTVAMARTNDPDSASSQFFINLKNNAFLNHTGKNARGWGYCVFGKVIAGMDTVNKMAAAQTATFSGHQDVPKNPIVVKQVLLKK